MPVPAESAFENISQLGRRLRASEFSAVELAEFFLGRLERLGPRFKAVVTVTRETSLSQARQADGELKAGKDRGPLHGIPYGTKDLLSTKGIPTTWGAAPYKDRIIDEDATVITRLRDAGAVLCAKLAMVEMAGGLGYRQANASFTGPGLNPWDEKTWAGGSSNGTGSAVGAGLVPFAIGSETWGSLVTPAGYCGVTGLRPTYGRVSRHGAMALSWTMDKLGMLSRSANDAGLVLNAIAGPDPLDPSASSRPFRHPPEAPAKPPYRFALLKGSEAGVQEEVRQNFEASIEILKTLGRFEEIDLPDLPYAAVAETLISCEMAAAFEGLITSGEVWGLTAPEDRFGGYAALLIPARDYINAFRIRTKIQRALDDLFAKFDAVVTSTLPTVSPPVDKEFREYERGYHDSSLGAAGNVAGLPALSVPNGFGEGRRPTALQFVGRAFEEDRLLAIGMKFQELTGWHREHPTLS